MKIEDLGDQVMVGIEEVQVDEIQDEIIIEDLEDQIMVIEIQADLVVQVMVDEEEIQAEGEMIEDLEGMQVHHDRVMEVTEEPVKEEDLRVDVEILDLIDEVQDQVSQDLTILKIEDKNLLNHYNLHLLF